MQGGDDGKEPGSGAVHRLPQSTVAAGERPDIWRAIAGATARSTSRRSANSWPRLLPAI